MNKRRRFKAKRQRAQWGPVYVRGDFLVATYGRKRRLRTVYAS